MKVARARSLAARMIVFAIVCTALVVVSHAIVMPRLSRARLHQRFERDQRAVAGLLGLYDDRAAAAPAVAAIAASRHTDVALVSAAGEPIARAGRPFAIPSARVLAGAIERGTADTGDGVVALRVDGAGPLAGSVLLLHGDQPGVPVEAMAVVIVLMLAMIAVASLWFARSLARPLARLAGAAERLGSGDLSARAGLDRADELGQVGQAFDAMAQRITALLDANRSLIASVSHELRTPMARIRVALELASESPADTQELLAGVSTDLGELERMVDDILTMTRLAGHDQGTLPPLRRERCLPEQLAADAQLRWRRVHGARELARDIAAGAPAIDGDPVLLRRVIDNLLDNAAKASPAGEPIVLRIAADDDAVRFEVVDRGAGLSAEEVAHAFTPFWRSDASRARDTGGVGLGLALARQIARAHGGDVALDSAPGRGTRAILQVPRATG